MYQRLSAVMFPILLLLLAGAAYWGYQENQEKNSILIKAENQYQRAFHDLSYHMDELYGELGNVLAVNTSSQDFHRKCLVNVWRLTSEAQNQIGQLPLTLTPLHETEQFLSQLSKFAYNVALRDMTEEPLTEEEMQALGELHQRSKEIAADIRDVQAKVLENNLRWMDVEIAVASEQEPMDNMIIDGFKLVNQKVTEYPEIEFGPSQPSLFQAKDYKSLQGTMMTPQEIKEKAGQFFYINQQASVDIMENGQGTDYNTYTVTIDDQQNRQQIKAEYSKRGGHLLWFMNNRDIAEREIDSQKAVDFAQQFLAQHEFTDLTPISYDEYENMASITFARKVDDIVIFPQKLTVKVALDNGETLGMQAVDYVTEDQTWNLQEPKLDEKEALEKLNPQFKVEQQTLGIMKNELQKDVMVYEFIGSLQDEFYRIYVNADTGKEEKVERIVTGDI